MLSFFVDLGADGSLCAQDRVLLGGYTDLIVEGVMPDLLHIVPVGNDSVLNWVLEALSPNIAVLLSHTNHDSLMAGTSATDGKTARGAPSPVNPAMHIPDPLTTS